MPAIMFANCDIPKKYHSLCNYKIHEIPNFIIDTYGIDGGEDLIIDYLRDKKGSISNDSFDEKDRFRMQEILNLALQNNSDAMVMLAKAYKNKDWQEYWLKKSAKQYNIVAIKRLKLIAPKEEKVKYKYLELNAIINLYQKKDTLPRYYKDKIEYELYKYKYGWKRRLLKQIENNIGLSENDKKILKIFPSKKRLLKNNNLFILNDISNKTYGNDFLKFQNIKSPDILFRKALCAAGLDSFYYLGYIKSGKLCPDNGQYNIGKSIELIHKSSVLENQLKNSATTGSGWQISSKYTEEKNIISVLEVMLMMPSYFDKYKIDFKVFNAYVKRYMKLKYNIIKYDKKTLNNFSDNVKTNLVLMLNDPILKLNPYSTDEHFLKIIKNMKSSNYNISAYYMRYYERPSKDNYFKKGKIPEFKKDDKLYSLIFGYIMKNKLYNQQKRTKFYQLLKNYYNNKNIKVDEHLGKIDKREKNLYGDTMDFFRFLNGFFKNINKYRKDEFYKKFKVAKDKANYFFEKSIIKYYTKSLIPLSQNKHFLKAKEKLNIKYYAKDMNDKGFFEWAQTKESNLYFRELDKLIYKYGLNNLKNILLGNKYDERVETYIDIDILYHLENIDKFKNKKEAMLIFKEKINKLLHNDLELIAKKYGSIYALEFDGTLKRNDYYGGLNYYMPERLDIFLYGFEPYTYFKKILLSRYGNL